MPRVFDSSVLLAILGKEPISPDTFRLLLGASISAVNVAEVYAKLAERGLPSAELDRLLLMMQAVVPSVPNKLTKQAT